ncbi:MAG: hypothetical protein WC263_03430 [Candidatus Micrarchaeia archaeon]|jgi:uncharacterized membrane protein YgcG
MKPQAIFILIFLCGIVTAQYNTTIDPPSMASGNVTSGQYSNYLVVGETSGISNSTNYSARVGAVSPIGGVYKVFLFCPSSSYVGQDLNCSVVLENEGEGTIESTSITWVDNNNNNIPDPGEPQASFSKEMQPQQNVTEPVSLAVTSSNPTGLIHVRVVTEYLGSPQPNSTASDSVDFLTPGGCPTGTTRCSDGVCRASCGGGGGGSGGGGSSGGGSGGGGPSSGNLAANLKADMGGNITCNVSLMREIISGENHSVITNTLINAGGALCILEEFRFTDAFPPRLPPGKATFSLPYASINGSNASFTFPVFLPNESRTIQYSFDQRVPPSWLKEFNASVVSARHLAGATPAPPQDVLPAAPAPGKGKIGIIDYPAGITLGLEETAIRQVIIKNIGNGTLHSTSLLISGLPLDSFAISQKAADIGAGGIQSFETVFISGNESAHYPFKFIISSVDGNAEVSSSLSVVGPSGPSAENKGEPFLQGVPIMPIALAVLLALLGLGTFAALAMLLRGPMRKK